MLSRGDTIDRYEVEDPLGTGGTAVVYRVRHQQLGTLHAMKVLSVTSEIIRERMLTEGRVQATLRHPNVVSVTDVIDVDGAPALVMEYIDGPSLEKAITRYKIGLTAAEQLFLGIVSGVREAHRHGLVHRDLKPANVLLQRTADGFVPKVTDFGLAKVLVEAQAKGTQTRSGIAMGTPAYMAPEQVRDAAAVDQRADIFALGCILYELATRNRVFNGEDTIDLFNQVLDGRYVPATELVPDLPERIDLAIRGALIGDRERRIPDCETLIAVLRGRTGWDIPDHQALPAPVPAPRAAPRHTAADDAPDLPLANRAPMTPEMALPREAAPGRAAEAVSRDLPSIADDEESWARDDEPRAATGLLLLGGAGLVLGTVVLLAAMVVIGVLIYTGDTAVATAPAADPSIAVAQPSEPEPVAVAEAPSPAPKPVLSAPEPRPAPRAVAAVVPPAPAVTPTPPPAPSELTVKILSAPPTASLRVDGADIGRTPAKFALKPGRHDVTLTSGADVATFSVDVKAGADNKWCYDFGSARSIEGSCP